jgi:leucyl-tRNA---protein transferase
MQNSNVILLHNRNLDGYLAAGMYRLGCMMFTTGLVEEAGKTCKVHWLRYLAQQFNLRNSHKKILNQNSQFKISIEKLFINQEVEDLYSVYKDSLPFSISHSLKENLFDYANYDTQLFIFETYAVKVFDGEKLIAVGIFDNGLESIAGIINIYHPDYKKHSLGKFLMLQKMLYTKAQYKFYYYPGYVIEENRKFDYKFFLGKNISELWNADNYSWYAAPEQEAFRHLD